MINNGINTRATYFGIILHYVTGALSFVLGSILILLAYDSFVGHYFNPKVLTITHILSLGCGVMIILGAIYQLLPVISGKAMFSTVFIYVTYSLLIVGLFLLSYAFWTFSVGAIMELGALMLFSSFLFFIVNVLKTLKGAKSSIEIDFISTSTIWLLVTAFIGCLMAFNLEYGFLPLDHLKYLAIHAHVGVFGWFLLLIIGVSSKLIPMFLLSHGFSDKPLKYAFYIVNLGLLLMLIEGFFFRKTNYFFYEAVLIFCGVFLYLSFVYGVYVKRMRKVIDFPMRKSLLAFVFLLLAIVLYFFAETRIVEQQQLINAIAFSFIMGFVMTLILGQTFKTLPFIVWIKRRKGADLKGVLPKHLFSNKLFVMQVVAYGIAYILLLVGIIFGNRNILHLGSYFLLGSSALYSLNVLLIILNVSEWKQMMKAKKLN